MKAELIAIGTEITTGSILNTHSQYLSKRLFDLGIEVFYQTVVDDDNERIKEVINIALNRADLIITTGGLGPTYDDMTKEIIFESLGIDLVLDEDIVHSIEDRFRQMNREMTDNNKKQALIPKGGKYLKNDLGTAPGIYIDHKDNTIIMLPGPTFEMKNMFEKEVIPLLKNDLLLLTKSIYLEGLGESYVENELKDIISKSLDIRIATFAKPGLLEIKLIGRGHNKDLIKSQMDDLIGEISNLFPENIFSYDDDNIANIIYKELKERGLKVAFAESCTGGLIASMITRVPNSSEVFDRGIVSYSNESKIQELALTKEVLDQYGPVSEETAIMMAKGIGARKGIDIGLSITGYAGPSGGSEDNPVGTVYIGIASKDRVLVEKAFFNGDRETIQIRAANKALFLLRKFIIRFY